MASISHRQRPARCSCLTSNARSVMLLCGLAPACVPPPGPLGFARAQIPCQAPPPVTRPQMTKVVLSIARATLLEALRSRMLWLVGVLLLVAAASAAFLQQVAITETARIQAAILAALLRGCAAFIVAAFVVMSMVRELNDKVLELMLAQPWPRAAYLFGKFVGFSAAALALAADRQRPARVPSRPPRGVALWTLSLACELVILAAMSLFCVITLTHVVPALAAVARLLPAGPLDGGDPDHRPGVGGLADLDRPRGRTGSCRRSPRSCRGST